MVDTDKAAQKAALWTLLGIFVVFKVVTTGIIIAMDPGGVDEAVGLFLAFHWPFILAGIGFVATAVTLGVLFRVRLVRVRARKKELQAAEWRTD